VDARGVARDPGIARGREHRVDQRALGDLPGQRVLPTPAAQDQDFHFSGALEAGLDRGWPETGASRLRTPDLVVSASRPRPSDLVASASRPRPPDLVVSASRPRPPDLVAGASRL